MSEALGGAFDPVMLSFVLSKDPGDQVATPGKLLVYLKAPVWVV